MAVVEFARNVLGLTDANSEEFAPDSKNQVIHIMDEQKNVNKKGGTMRLRKLSMHTKRRKQSKKHIWQTRNSRKA